MDMEKISVSTQTAPEHACPQKNPMSKLLEFLTKLLNLCQNTNSLSITDNLTKIAQETLVATMQTTQSSPNEAVCETSNINIEVTNQNRISHFPINNKNTYKDRFLLAGTCH
jgi:hypothetical protein